MREFIFRVWDGVNMMVFDFDDVRLGFLDPSGGGVSEPVIMQYTGMSDKNGKKIYEGDLVHFIKPEIPYITTGNGYSDVEIEEKFELRGEVKFLYGGWFLDTTGDGKGGPLDFDGRQILEVIGNKYEGELK